MASTFPPNVHISTHPCLQAKLSRLRSDSTNAKDTQTLVHEIATIISCEALAHSLQTSPSGAAHSPLGYPYPTTTIHPSTITIVPILRSGLSMVEAVQSILPDPVPVHHLGMYREKTTLQPVEYYNNLPYHNTSSQGGVGGGGEGDTGTSTGTGVPELAIIVDPIVATGSTLCAAIDTLRDWGVRRIVSVAVLGSAEGVRRAAGEWVGGVEVWVGGVDAGLDERGMIKPGLGDIGDRLYLTMGK